MEPTTNDVDRFWSYVVREPAGLSCWIWTGAVADDGYGRFWLGQTVVRPHRFAWLIATGEQLDPGEVIEHVACDNPICVRVEGNPATDHLERSTQAANAARMGRKGRGGGRNHWRGIDRATFAEQSHRLRDAIRDNRSADEVARIISGETNTQPGLF
jgi:hypothetical protein